MRKKSDKEVEVALRLLKAVKEKDLLESRRLYDETAKAMIEAGADVSEMVGFGIAKALTLHRLEQEDEHQYGKIH